MVYRKIGRYKKVEVAMWDSKDFNQLSPLKPSGQALWLYLLTNRDTTVLPGLFKAGKAQIAEILGWELEDFEKAFEELSKKEMAKADWKARVVWLPRAITYNPPESVNVVKGWKKAWPEIPDCDLKVEAYNTYKEFLSGFSKSFLKAFADAITEGITVGISHAIPDGKPKPKAMPYAMPKAMPYAMTSPNQITNNKEQRTSNKEQRNNNISHTNQVDLVSKPATKTKQNKNILNEEYEKTNKLERYNEFGREKGIGEVPRKFWDNLLDLDPQPSNELLEEVWQITDDGCTPSPHWHYFMTVLFDKIEKRKTKDAGCDQAWEEVFNGK